MEKLKVGIVGLGMVGGSLERWFLEKKDYKRGKDLFCFDIDEKKGCLDDVSKAEIVFICVPTPSSLDGSCDISIVESVINHLCDGERAIVIKSTIPPGTTLSLSKKHSKKGDFLFSPEFLTEAQAWNDFIKPDLQIVAAANDKAKKWEQVVSGLLPTGSFNSPGVLRTRVFYEMNSTQAELVKYTINCYGAFRVTFFNMLYDFSKIFGVDFELVHSAVSSDRRIGDSWSYPLDGEVRGFTGLCFPKDLSALVAHLQNKIGELEEGKTRENKKQDYDYNYGLILMRAYIAFNENLLASQGFTVEELSVHSSECLKKIKEKKKN